MAPRGVPPLCANTHGTHPTIQTNPRVTFILSTFGRVAIKRKNPKKSKKMQNVAVLLLAKHFFFSEKQKGKKKQAFLVFTYGGFALK